MSLLFCSRALKNKDLFEAILSSRLTLKSTVLFFFLVSVVICGMREQYVTNCRVLVQIVVWMIFRSWVNYRHNTCLSLMFDFLDPWPERQKMKYHCHHNDLINPIGYRQRWLSILDSKFRTFLPDFRIISFHLSREVQLRNFPLHAINKITRGTFWCRHFPGRSL